MVRVLVDSGRGEPSLSMTMVQSRLVRTEEADSLLCWVVGGLPGAVLAALWAQVCSGGGGRWGGRCADVVVWYWSSCSLSVETCEVRASTWSSKAVTSSIWHCWTTIRCACIAEKDSSKAVRRSLTPRLVSLRSAEICLRSG